MAAQYDGLRLHELVAENAWEKVLVRLNTHPHEALHVVDSLAWLGRRTTSVLAPLIDDSNITALHLLCAQTNSPRRVLRTYLEVAPTAIKIVTPDNKTCLFLSCLAKHSPEKLSIVATADPDAVMVQDADGRNAFHACCLRGMPDNSLLALMNAVGPVRTQTALLAGDRRNNHAPIHYACTRESQIRLEDFALVFQRTRIESLDINPLQVLCNEYQTNFQSCLRTAPIPTTAVSAGDPSPYCSPDRALSLQRFWMWRPMDALFLRRAWNMAFTLLGAYGSDMSTYPLLHECLERDPACTSEMFDYVLCLNPHYVCQLRDGLLPLHVICRLAAQDGLRHWAERIRKIVQLYPKAASIPDPDGNFPLQIIVRPTVTYEHAGPVLEACPNALARLDLPETLYPYALSQLVRSESVNAIYQIIRETPTLATIR